MTGVSSMTRWLSFVPLWKKSSLRPPLFSPSPEWPGPSRTSLCLISEASIVHLSLYSSPASLVSVPDCTLAARPCARPTGLLWRGSTATKEQTHRWMHATQKGRCEALIILPLTWERARFFSKPTNLFSNPSRACAGSSPHPIPFLDLPGVLPHPLWLFSQIKLRLFVSPFDSYWACPEFCFIIWFLPCMRSPPPALSWLPLGLCLAKIFPLFFFFSSASNTS